MRSTSKLAYVLVALSAGSVSAGLAADGAPINKGATPAGPVSSAGVEAQAVAAPRPNPMELVYVPIQPCRAFSKKTLANVAASYQITGSGNFTTQGGPSTGCGIPDAATAVTLNVTTAAAPASGLLTAYADGATRPGVATARFVSSIAEATSATVGVGSNGRMAVYPNQTVNVAGDITGYFAPQIQVYMNYDGTAYSATTRILATQKLGTGSYRVQVDRNVQLCSIHVNIDGGYYYASAYPSGDNIYIQTWGISSGTPTATDLYHNVSAKC